MRRFLMAGVVMQFLALPAFAQTTATPPPAADPRTPPAVVMRLFDATATALRQPEVRQTFAREGTEVSASKSPEDFAAFLAEDAKFWVRLVKEAKVVLE